jgi:NAD(P)-dependent dehydrogenase (short-subunit alcohol dehydrogenase family)
MFSVGLGPGAPARAGLEEGVKAMLLKDEVAVVTGGGMGIGYAIAVGLAREGAHVAIFDINSEAGRKAASDIERSGRKAFFCQVDVSDPVGVDTGVKEVLEVFGRIDILINNAGITHPSVSILDLDPEWLEKVTNVDFKGVYLCARRVGREMVERRKGVVINIASVAGLTSLPLPVYGPIKSAVIMLTQILARDWAPHGVRVNAIAPGYVLTPLLEGLFQKGLRDRDTILRSVPMRRFIMPEDIANAAIFLCSEKAACITGVTLPVDGGFLCAGGWRAYGYE